MNTHTQSGLEGGGHLAEDLASQKSFRGKDLLSMQEVMLERPLHTGLGARQSLGNAGLKSCVKGIQHWVVPVAIFCLCSTK